MKSNKEEELKLLEQNKMKTKSKSGICPHKVQYRFNPIKLVWEIKYGDSEWEDFAIGFVNETEVKQMIEMVVK